MMRILQKIEGYAAAPNLSTDAKNKLREKILLNCDIERERRNSGDVYYANLKKKTYQQKIEG